MNLSLGLSLTSRRVAAETLGPELIVNGDMSSDVGWTLEPEDGTLEIAGGVMNAAAGDDAASAYQEPALEAGSTYRLSGTAGSLSGAIQLVVGGQAGTDLVASGAFTQDITAKTVGFDSLASIRFLPGTTATPDNVSLRKVLNP